eukprot:CAMPEP_0178490682 /NCGR_PEP_ID=MMETSP0696-20121128/11016_1 /TAXON_ID=265572 /ORGANISM="Extubocellulus spinifer, Strain CCMP396" /LENGTH=353 /DNA_ID=CAMNT_0020118519 /DNA_START=185 /DNA_END=1246 /DNA_ORIENTATION=-
MVNLAGRTALRASTTRLSPSTHAVGERPPDPASLVDSVDRAVATLTDWFDNKSSILCLTGAGISTESGVPDYRGSSGSYHRGHKPMVHDQFMNFESQRRRYWGRAMVGWRDFAAADPNSGHLALSDLERMGRIGVSFVDREEYYHPDDAMDFATSSGFREETIITQNVDGLHQKAGSRFVTNLHGINDRLRCMECGAMSCRHDFHNKLDEMNKNWLQDALNDIDDSGSGEEKLRPDGDAYIEREDYSGFIVPNCSKCGSGFVKPHVVFFGDSVPKHRVDRCFAAVDAADGLLCIGSSLAVHSAYRFVAAAAKKGIPIAVLNVGETRAEVSGLDVTKIEAPAGPTLEGVVKSFS